jgi:hypothetical protein
MDDRRPSGARRVGRAVVIVLVVLGVLAVSGKYWVAPAIIRWQVGEALADYWDGSVRIDRVEFGYTGPVVLRGVEILDRDGRVWASAGEVRAILRDWPGFRPVLTDIEIARPDVRMHVIDGRCAPPLHRPPPRPPRPYIDIQSVRIADATVSVVNRDVPGEAGVLLKDLAALVRVTDSAMGVDDLTGSICGGTLRGSAAAETGPRASLQNCRGRFALRNVQTPQLLRALATGTDMQAGRMDGELVFQAERPELDLLRAKGQLRLERAHFGGIALVRRILESIGLTDMANFRVDGDFTVRGQVVVIDRSRLASPLSALDVQPGGTLNLQTQEIDVHVVTAVFSDFRGLMDKLKLPLINPLAGLTGDLLHHMTRLRVQGKWSDPPDKLIRKEIARDIQDGTLKFLTDAIRGGDTGDIAVKTFEDLFKALNGNGARPAATQGSPGKP